MRKLINGQSTNQLHAVQLTVWIFFSPSKTTKKKREGTVTLCWNMANICNTAWKSHQRLRLAVNPKSVQTNWQPASSFNVQGLLLLCWLHPNEGQVKMLFCLVPALQKCSCFIELCTVPSVWILVWFLFSYVELFQILFISYQQKCQASSSPGENIDYR